MRRIDFPKTILVVEEAHSILLSGKARTPNEKNYHEQPRLFLSLADTFSYIKRHDEELLKQKQKGIIYFKLIREG